MLESLFLLYKNHMYNKQINFSSSFLSSILHVRTYTPVRTLLNVRWQNESELGRVHSDKSRKPNLVILFQFFNSLFLPVLKCLLSVF